MESMFIPTPPPIPPGPKFNKINNNTIINNDYGIGLSKTINNTINTNIVCNNTILDFYLYNNKSFGDYGDNNSCDNPDTWDDLDNNTIGCKYSC